MEKDPAKPTDQEVAAGGSQPGGGADKKAPQVSSTVSDILTTRLHEERKMWRKDHPHGFVAKPVQNENASINMTKWYCEIPGPKGTPWEAGVYKLFMEFPPDYPLKPPKCQFKPVLPHPNIYPSGTVCLSILNDEEDWKPNISIKTLLLGIQKLLRDEPNINSPAQYDPCALYKNDREAYYAKVREFARLHMKKD